MPFGFFFFFLMIRRPPRSTLFPYTTALPIYDAGRRPVRGLPRQAARAQRSQGLHHRSEEHTSELQSPCNLVCRLLLEKKVAQPPSRSTGCSGLPPLGSRQLALLSVTLLTSAS